MKTTQRPPVRYWSPDEVEALLREVGAFLSGHFVLTSERHSADYINADKLYEHPEALYKIGSALAYLSWTEHFNYFAGPATGGNILGRVIEDFWTNFHDNVRILPSVMETEKVAGSAGFVFADKQDARFLRGSPFVVVEDIVTTGKSTKQVVELIRKHRGEVIQVVAICKRGRFDLDAISDPPKFSYLLSKPMDTWTEAECPLCKRDVVQVNTEVGHGKAFLARKASEQAPTSWSDT